ncbi:MAG: hypothetical protein IJ341_02700 [Bacteroidales bacterium]|nr:hypothetical protein [Bacteroidales bacterium]
MNANTIKPSTLKSGDYIKFVVDGCMEAEAIVYRVKKDVAYVYVTSYSLADRSMVCESGCEALYDDDTYTEIKGIIKHDDSLVKEALEKIKIEKKLYSVVDSFIRENAKKRDICDLVHTLTDEIFRQS